MTIESATVRYQTGRTPYLQLWDQEQIDFDFSSLLDATWSFKSAVEVFSTRNHRLGQMVKNDLFRWILICTREIDGNAERRKRPTCSIDCWVSFNAIVETMFVKGVDLSNELLCSLARVLFIAALVFDMPDQCNIENILSNPKVRRTEGAFPASSSDIEFSKTLPAVLSGPFASISDVLVSLKSILDFYRHTIELG
jgi:hypothetical protein